MDSRRGDREDQGLYRSAILDVEEPGGRLTPDLSGVDVGNGRRVFRLFTLQEASEALSGIGGRLHPHISPCLVGPTQRSGRSPPLSVFGFSACVGSYSAGRDIPARRRWRHHRLRARAAPPAARERDE